MSADEFPRWASIVNSLRRRSDIEMAWPPRDLPVKSPFSARMVAMNLEEIEKASGVPTAEGPGPFATLLSFAHGKLVWRFKGEPFVGGGEIHFAAIGALLRPCETTPGWHVLDDHPDAGDGVMTVFAPRDGHWSFGLYDNGEIDPMAIDFATYMRSAIDLRGWFSWQRLFCEKTLRDDASQFHRKSLVAMFEHLPRIAPEIDLGPYAERFAERGGGRVKVSAPSVAEAVPKIDGGAKEKKTLAPKKKAAVRKTAPRTRR